MGQFRFDRALPWARAAACLSAVLQVGAAAAASAYQQPAENGIAWLVQQQDLSDGSWGATDDVKYTYTSEAVVALSALNKTGRVYQAGLAWLRNHPPANLDASARRILALGLAGGVVQQDIQVVQGAQNLTAPGNSGWGLSGAYQGSALDTSLSLQALSQQGVTANVAAALTYLVSSQITGSDSGWALGQESASDLMTTALVVQSLIPLKAMNTSVPAAITRGFDVLNTKVSASSSTPQIAASIVAYLRNSTSSPQAASLLTVLLSRQSGDGSWQQDPFATAMALRAFAAAMGKDLAAQKVAVNLPDNALRGALNASLGKGALDAVTVGELQAIVSLDASNLGIVDLTGLEQAINLTYLDLRNNQIVSFNPVNGLVNANIIKEGNPGDPALAGQGDAPTLPQWGAILMGALLLLATWSKQSRLRLS